MWSIPSHLAKSRETVVLETALVAHTGCMFFFLLLFFLCSIWQKQTTAGPVMGAGRVLIAPFFCSEMLSRAVIITTGILTTLATPADCPPDSFPKCTSSEISLNNRGCLNITKKLPRVPEKIRCWLLSALEGLNKLDFIFSCDYAANLFFFSFFLYGCMCLSLLFVTISQCNN